MSKFDSLHAQVQRGRKFNMEPKKKRRRKKKNLEKLNEVSSAAAD